VFTVVDGREDQVLCNAGAANQFHHDIDIWPLYQRECIVGCFGSIANELARPDDVRVGDRLDQDSTASPPADLLLITAQDCKSAPAHGADTQQADLHGLH